MERFVCVKCGDCCRFNITDANSYPAFVKDSSIIQLSSSRLFLFDWEAELFPKGTVAPGTGFFDLKNNRLIVFNYTIKDDICPNLVGKECRVHASSPISCRLFPCPYRDISSRVRIDSDSCVCPADLSPNDLNKLLDIGRSSDNELRKKLLARYDSGFIYGIASSIILEAYGKLIKDLEEQGKIKIAKAGYPLDMIAKRIASSGKIGISKLFFEHNKYNLHELILSRQGIEKIKQKIISGS